MTVECSNYWAHTILMRFAVKWHGTFSVYLFIAWKTCDQRFLFNYSITRKKYSHLRSRSANWTTPWSPKLLIPNLVMIPKFGLFCSLRCPYVSPRVVVLLLIDGAAQGDLDSDVFANSRSGERCLGIASFEGWHCWYCDAVLVWGKYCYAHSETWRTRVRIFGSTEQDYHRQKQQSW